MSVVRGLSRPHFSTPTSYICHSCRHKLIAAHTQHSRWQSTLSPVETSNHDDWLSNFNDLSVSNASVASNVSKSREISRPEAKKEAERSDAPGKKPLTRRQRMSRDKDLTSSRKPLDARLSATENEGVEDEPLLSPFTEWTEEEAIASMLATRVRSLSYYRASARRGKQKGGERVALRKAALIESGRVVPGTGFVDIIRRKMGQLAQDSGAGDVVRTEALALDEGAKALHEPSLLIAEDLQFSRAVMANMLANTVDSAQAYREQAESAHRQGDTIGAGVAEYKARLVEEGRVMVGATIRNAQALNVKRESAVSGVGSAEQKARPGAEERAATGAKAEASPEEMAGGRALAYGEEEGVVPEPVVTSQSGSDDIPSRNFNTVVQDLKTRLSQMFGTTPKQRNEEILEILPKESETDGVELSSAVGAGLAPEKELPELQQRLHRPELGSTSHIVPTTTIRGAAFGDAADVTAKREQDVNANVLKRVNMPGSAPRMVFKRSTSIAKPTASMSPIQKVRESQGRPKWGGVEDGNMVFLETSKRPEKDLPVKYKAKQTLRPFGVEELSTTMEYGDSPGDLVTSPITGSGQPSSNGEERSSTHDRDDDDGASYRLKRLHPLTEAPGGTGNDDIVAHTTEPAGMKGLSRHAQRRRARRKIRQSEANGEASIAASPSKKPGDSTRALTGELPVDGVSETVVEHKSLWKVMDTVDASTTPPLDEATSADASQTNKHPESPPLDLPSPAPADVDSINPSELEVTPLNIPQPSVPPLAYDLDRVLFNPGVYQLQDPQSRVFNFDPYLQKIMPVAEFDFNALKEYKTSSKDTALVSLAREHGKRYIGSTSSMTSTLAHFHYLISDFRPLNLNMLSRGFSDKLDTFTAINRAPNAIFLRWKNGTYAIDADKEFDSSNVLMLLGKSMEKLLTMPTSEFERFRKSDPREVSEQERNDPEAFEYTTMGGFLMRSQLDAYDSRLPGNGMFDLKTRAVLTVRMDAEDFQPMTGYEIQQLQGRYFSYEREYYDMMRSTMLKYMLQARMGCMDGIFVAYHNVERIFGFQYLPISELDRALHGQTDRCLGDQEFKTSLNLMNKILDKATAKYPEQSMRFHFETTSEALMTGSPTTVMWIFGEPMEDEDIDVIQSKNTAKIAEFERNMMGIEKDDEASKDAETTDAAVNGSDVAEVFNPGTVTTDASKPAVTTKEPPFSDSSTEYTTTSSPADPNFFENILNTDSKTRRPLFVASLICKSRLNGTSLTRPETLKPSDSWEIEYLLQEWDVNDAMWARYEQTKGRRKDTFQRVKEDEAPEGEEMTKEQKKEKSFIAFLRSMSEKGREFRKAMDELEKGREKVVWGQPRQGVEEKED